MNCFHLKHLKRAFKATAVFGLISIPGLASSDGTITFPSRSSDLANDSYWTVQEYSEGCCTLDLNVQRWDGSQWRGGDPGGRNEDDYTWNVPLYAPANGVIASCWRNFPDNPRPGEKITGQGIFTSGNHISLLTDDGDLIGLAHFKSGTIPANLCPRNAGSEAFPTTSAKIGGWRVASYIPPDERPRVREGQFLGRAGNSGNSSGPHLHISMKEVTGTAVGSDGVVRETRSKSSKPLTIRNHWAKLFINAENSGHADWWRLRGVGFRGNADCSGNYLVSSEGVCRFKFLHPSPFLRRGNGDAGAVRFVETYFMSEDQVISAVRLRNGNLKLIAWAVNDDGEFTRQGDINAGAIKSVKLSSPEPGHILAATQLTNNRLKMIAFRVSPAGTFTRVAERTAGPVSGLEVATVSDIRPVREGQRRFETVTVTAVRTAAQTLKLITWDLAIAGNGSVSVERLADASAGAVGTVSISPSKHFYGVYTAVSDSDQNLKVIPWTLATNLQSFTRKADGQAGRIGPHLGVAPLGAGVATAMRDSSGNLRVITWKVSGSGDIVERQETATGGDVFQTRVLAAPDASGTFSTISRVPSGRVYLIGWAADKDGSNLRRIGSSRMGRTKGISAATVTRSYSRMKDRGMIATGVIRTNDGLRMTAWDTNLVE